MSNSYDAIVVGSGLGGLTAGALLSRAGARVLVLERSASFGGAATTFQRGRLTVEASLHETTDPCGPGGVNRDIFAALDLEDDIEFVPIEIVQEIRCPLIGEPFVLPHGWEAVEASLVRRFPHQRRSVRAFLRQMRRCQQAIEFFNGDHGILWKLTHAAELPLDLWSVMRDAKSSLSDVLARRFGDDEAIKFALAGNLPYFADDPDMFWWLAFVMVHGGFLRSGGSFIKGGSKVLSSRLVQIVREEGGDALGGRQAVAIELGPRGEVTGVRHRSVAEGDEAVARAPLVFANAAPQVIEAMLPNDECRRAFMAPFEGRPLSISLFTATFGLSKRPSELGVGAYSTQLIPAWMNRLSDFKRCAAMLGSLPDGRLPAVSVADYSQIDSGLTDSGLFPLNVLCTDRLENWDGLGEPEYGRKKDAWADALLERLDEEWPGIAGAVVERSVATARTLHETLNTPGGVVYGFAQRPPDRVGQPAPGFETAIPGLWLASSFAGFGGFAGAMAAGAGAARAAMRQRSG